MRYCKTDFNFPFVPSVLRPCVIDFFTAAVMLQALALTLALLLAMFVSCSTANLDNDLLPVFRITTCFFCL